MATCIVNKPILLNKSGQQESSQCTLNWLTTNCYLYTEGLEIYGPDLLAFYANTLSNHYPNVARKSITPGMIKNYKHSSQKFWDAPFGNVVWHCCTEDIKTSSSRKCTIHAWINFNPCFHITHCRLSICQMQQDCWRFGIFEHLTKVLDDWNDVSTVAHNWSHQNQMLTANYKSLTSNSNRSQQIQIAHSKFKLLTANSNRSQRITNHLHANEN